MPKFCTDVKWQTKWPRQWVSKRAKSVNILNFKLWFFTFSFAFLVYYGGTLRQFSGTTPGNGHRATTPELSFPKKKRLVSNRQFKAVLARNLRFSDGLLTLYMAENDCGYRRLGVSVSKSCGNAVVRNRLKRLLREALRQSQRQIPSGFDYLLMISPISAKLDKSGRKEAVRQLTFEQVKASFLTLVAEAVGKIG